MWNLKCWLSLREGISGGDSDLQMVVYCIVVNMVDGTDRCSLKRTIEQSHYGQLYEA